MKLRNKMVKISLLVTLLTISIFIPILSVLAKKKVYVLSPIYINEAIPGLTWADWAMQPWCKGSGTEEDPYMIKNVKINGEGSPFCMMIVNSEVYFKIQHCVFYNAKTTPEARAAGLILLNTINGVIFKNQFLENGWPGSGLGGGIALISSHNNKIQKNLCSENDGAGIYLEWSSNNDIRQNDCIGNNGGVVVASSHGNIIYKNYCVEHSISGIRLVNAYDQAPQDNIVWGNTVENNQYGILLNDADNNDIFRNNIAENTYGMLLNFGSENNLIYHNNFFDNNIQAFDYLPGMNNWHNPYMLEGNYWSDYTGIDSDGDGIGDSPWPWPGFDNYPFMKKNGWEYFTPIEEEILNVMFDPEPNRLGGSRTVRSNETSYLIVGLGQSLLERTQRLWCPPYTVQVWFGEMEVFFQDTFWYLDTELNIYPEIALWQIFYLIIEPYALFDWGFELGWNEFQWEISFYNDGELQIWSFTSYFELV